MTAPVPRPLLASLRASVRLAVLVLFVFALKIGTSVACAKHDFAEMGLGAGADQGLVVSAPNFDGSDQVPAAVANHAGTCSHCSSHHGSALLPAFSVSISVLKSGLNPSSLSLPPSASQSFELRPPIA